MALLLRASEMPPFPKGPARENHRRASSLQRSSRIWVRNRVYTQLHQIGAYNPISSLSELGRRLGHHGDANFCWWHKQKRLFRAH